MVAGGATLAGAVIGGPAGAVVSLAGGMIGAFVDGRLGLFSPSRKPDDFQGTQPEGLAPGTPFAFCVGQKNRIGGQRLWTAELFRERAAQQPRTKRGDVVPEIIRASWATAIVAHPIESVERMWADSELVYVKNQQQPDQTTEVGTLVTMDWWSAFRFGGPTLWHLILETVSDASGNAVPGAPSLGNYGVGTKVNLTLTDTTHGVQVSRKQGSGTQTPWLVLSSETLPKGNSRLVLNLLFDPSRPLLDFGFYDKNGSVPGDPRVVGPFTYPVTSGSTLFLRNLNAPAWKGNLLNDPATDFEVRLGAADQSPFNSMVAVLGGEAEHYPGIAAISAQNANVADFGSRTPNTECEVSTSATPLLANEAVDRIMADRFGFRNQGGQDPEFDTAALFSTPGITPKTVHGYQWTSGLTAIEVMQPVLLVNDLRVHESRGRLWFNYNRARPVVDINPLDLDARPFGDSPGELLEYEPTDDIQAPDVIDVHFADIGNDNQRQVATAQRQGLRTPGQDPIREDVRLENYAMAFEDGEGLAQDLLREAWERRQGIRCRLPLRYDHLECGDVMRMQGSDAPPGGPWLLAIDRIERGDMLELECFVLSGEPRTELAQGASFTRTPPRPQPSPPLVVEVLDIGPLDDAHAQTPGYYVAASKFAPNNLPAGGAIWRKEAGETNPHNVGAVTQQARMGYTVDTAVLGSAAGDVIDETNSIDVDVHDGDLASVTEAELMAGANRCVIGNEVLAFRDATALDTGPRRFRLSGLLRGLRGTAAQIGGHTARERFVFLGHKSDPLPLNFVRAEIPDVGTAHVVQAVASGQSTDTTTEYTHTVEASTGRPLPPYDVIATAQPNGDYVFEWKRRSRVEWDSLDDAPQLAAVERYTLILNGTRTKTIEGNPTDPTTKTSRTYTAAEQAADVIGLTFTAEVAEVDPAVGAGRSTTITVTT